MWANIQLLLGAESIVVRLPTATQKPMETYFWRNQSRHSDTAVVCNKLQPPPPNMAGIHQANKEVIDQAICTPYVSFIYWLTDNHSIDLSSHKTLREAFVKNKWCKLVVELFTLNNFPQLEKEFRSNRRRKQRTGKNKTRDTKVTEKKIRTTFKNIINNLLSDEDSCDVIAIYNIQTIAETYHESLKKWIKLAKKSIINTSLNVKEAGNLKSLPQYSLLMLNDTTVTWADVIPRLIDHSDNIGKRNRQYTLEPATLLRLAKLIQGNQNGTSLNISNHSEKQRVNIINAVCIHLPVLAILQKDDCVLFDLHQLTVSDWMEIINADTIRNKEIQRQGRTESSLQPRKNAQDAVGAVPLHVRFPNLVPVVVQFVQQNGVSAEKRRRHTTATVGVGLEDIRKHVLTEIPLIANWGLSVDTIARLFMAPHGKKNSRFMYKNLIEARTPGKDDTLRQGNANQHAAACQLKMIMEMAFDYRDECVAFSADDKAQVSIGKMCVSKFVKIKNKFPVGAAPISLDHTFVIAACWSLTVAGLLEITPHPHDFNPDEDMEATSDETDDVYDDEEKNNIFRMAGEDNNNVMVTTQARRRRRQIIPTNFSDSSHMDMDLLSTSGPLNLTTGGNLNKGGTDVTQASEQNEAEYSDNSAESLHLKHKPSGRLRRHQWINQPSSQENHDNKNSDTISITKQTTPTTTLTPPRLVLDRHSRQHIDVPTSGKSHLFIRPTKTCASCPYTHYMDLMTAWKRNPKPNVVLSVDGGTDYTCRSLKNLYWYGKFFKEANLDSFNIAQNAANYSAFNHWIEHHWSWCSQNLIGVELTGTLPSHDGLTPGEYHKIPACTKECQKNRKDTKKSLIQKSGDGLTEDTENPQKKRARTIRAKKVKTLQVNCLPECLNLKNDTLATIKDDEAKVFQNASEELKAYWHGKEWDTHKVDCQVISDHIPHEVRAEIRHLDRYHDCVDRKKFLPGGEFHAMFQFYLWMFAHLLKKHTHNIAFAAKLCGNKKCDHKRCREPGTNMGNAMRDSNMPCNPTKGPLVGHFHTYLEHKSQGGKKQDRPDKYIQLERKNHVTYLPVVCPFQGEDNAICGKSYIASSKTEAANHAKKYHRKGLLKQRHWASLVKKGRAAPYTTKKTKKPARKRYLYRCTHMADSTAKVYCNRSFKSHRLLKEHQKILQHKNQGRQKSPHPGSSRSQRTTTEEKKKERQKRVDLRIKRAKSRTLTKSVDPKGKIGTNGTSRISGQHKQHSESEDESSLVLSEEKALSEEDSSHSKEEVCNSNDSKSQDKTETWGASVSKCLPNHMAVVQTFYDDKRRGMELLRIVKMTSKTFGKEMYEGILYMPDNCSNTDPNCVHAKWTSTKKKETANCWSVSLYFPRMIGVKGKKIPANIIRQIQESFNFFDPSSSLPTPSSSKCVTFTASSNKEQLSNVTDMSGTKGNRKASNGTNGKQKNRVHFSNLPSRELNSSPPPSDTDKIQSQASMPKYGADVSQCIPKSMAVVKTKYDNGHRGIEVYKVLEMTVQTTGNEAFRGTRYLPGKGITSDENCLNEAWYPTKEREIVMCWSVTLYFPTLTSGFSRKKRIPGAVRGKIRQMVFNSCIESIPVGSSETMNMEVSGEAKQARKRRRSKSPTESDSDTVPVHINVVNKSSRTVVSTALETEHTSAVYSGGANAQSVTKSVLSTSNEDCALDNFMICSQDSDDGKGIDLYKIKSVGDETIKGFKYVPMTNGQRTTDPMCLKSKWHTFKLLKEVPKFAVLIFFSNLNKDCTLPQKIQKAILPLAVFKDNKPEPIQIVKTRISQNTQSTQYLMEFEGGSLIWMEEEEVKKKELHDWIHRMHRHGKSAECDGKKESLNEDWLSPISQHQMLMYDKQMIRDGGPLNQIIVDVSMEILAAQTSLFVMQSCVQPVTGYVRTQTSVHLHVHHCGRKENHFVSSLYAKNEIWFLDFNQSGNIPPIVITALIDMHMQTDDDHAVKILRLTKQKRQHTCGILNLAAAVEIALSNNTLNDPSLLTTVEFDEAKAPEWLISCLTNSRFVSCPTVVTNSSALPSSASSPALAYSTMAVTSHFLTTLRIRKPIVDKRQETPYGSGSTKADECYTSNGQKACCRLLVGCTVNMESRDNSPNGLYVVLEVNADMNTITIEPVNPYAQPRKIVINSTYAFCIIGPPSLRYTEFAKRHTTDFRLSAPHKIMIMYPVSQGYFSNSLFDSPIIHEYSVIEAEPCVTRFDVDCLLRFLSGKQINLQVRIVDLFPINCLATFYPNRKDLKQLKELYVTVLECLFEEHNIEFEKNPFVRRRITDYPAGVFTVASKLPPFQPRLVTSQPRQLQQRNEKKKLVYFPDEKTTLSILEAGSEKVFSDVTFGDVYDWAWSTANTELADKPNITVEYSKHVEDSLCCLCYVVSNKIFRNNAGNQLTSEQFLLLEESCTTFIREMDAYYYKQLLDKDSDKECAQGDFDEWRQLGDSQWGGYRIKIYLDNGIPTIVDVKGIQAHYDTKLDNMSNNISLGGLVNFGGQKLVLAAIFRGNLQSEDVVVVLPRYSECPKSKENFQLEMTMMSVMDTSPNGVRVKYVNKAECWAMLERLDGTIEEYIYKFKWNTPERRVAIVDVLLKSSEALAAVHEKSLVHRDVKPDNFLYQIEKSGNSEPKLLVKISDFGLAMFVSGESSNGAAGAAGDVGTSSYKAPEVINGQTYGQKADVYSMGVTLFELVYWRKRFSILRRDIKNQKKFKDIEKYAASVPTPNLTGKHGKEIDDLIRLCTAEKATSRPTMKEVVKKLKNLVLTVHVDRSPKKPNILNKKFASVLT